MQNPEVHAAVDRLRAFVVGHATLGGCRILSQGAACTCPRCDLDRVGMAALQEGLSGPEADEVYRHLANDFLDVNRWPHLNRLLDRLGRARRKAVPA